MHQRPKKVFNGQNGYEIKGWADPSFKRAHHCSNDDDIELDVPNGDVEFGRSIYNQACAGCHDLDGDLDQGPALRNCYIRRLGANKKFSNYGWELRARKLYWTRKLLWAFLQNPEKMFQDTNMSFDGIQDPYILGSLVDYMQYLRVYTADNRGSKRPIF